MTGQLAHSHAVPRLPQQGTAQQGRWEDLNARQENESSGSTDQRAPQVRGRVWLARVCSMVPHSTSQTTQKQQGQSRSTHPLLVVKLIGLAEERDQLPARRGVDVALETMP